MTNVLYISANGVKATDVVTLPSDAQKAYKQLYLIIGTYYTINSYDVSPCIGLVEPNTSRFIIPTIRKYDGTAISDARDLQILLLKYSS